MLDERDRQREKAEENARGERRTRSDRRDALQRRRRAGLTVYFATYCGAGDGAVLLCDASVVAIQIPAKTAISPPTRLSVIGSPTN